MMSGIIVAVPVADEMHVVYECPALRPFRQQYAALSLSDTMRSFLDFACLSKFPCNASQGHSLHDSLTKITKLAVVTLQLL